MLGRPSRKKRKDLEDHGRSAVAVVLEVGGDWLTMSSGNETSWTNEVAVQSHIRVEPVGEPSFEFKGRLRYWQSQTPVAGDRIWVLFDPDDHENVMLDVSEHRGALGGHFSKEANADTAAGMTWATDPTPTTSAPGPGFDLGAILQAAKAQAAQQQQAAADPIARLQQLADLRDRGVLTPEEFEAQKRRLLDEQR